MPMKTISPFQKFAFPLCAIVLSISCETRHDNSRIQAAALLPQVEQSLKELATVWYPRSVDSVHGGYWTDFNASWKLDGPQDKMIVSQSRHLWSASKLALFYDEDQYQHIAAHGYRFLRDYMWDSMYGGFNTRVSVEGDSVKTESRGKSAYGNSFAIYALATFYKASKDTMALGLAKKTFYWLEEHSHDPEFKGYFDVLQQDGSWMLNRKENNGDGNFARKDWKDQNSSIHLLESFTALYEVWPNELLGKRLLELLLLIRDTITSEVGSLTLHLQRDWTPVSLRDSSETYRKKNFWVDHISFGHDVETAFLLLEASHVLGLENDTLTYGKAKKMVDHAVEMGWDAINGGFFDGGYYHQPSVCIIENRAKVWWTQAEGLNSLLLMARLYSEEERYLELFKKQWGYIETYLIDNTHGIRILTPLMTLRRIYGKQITTISGH